MAQTVTMTHVCCGCEKRTIRFTCPKCGHRFCTACKDPLLRKKAVGRR